MRAIFVGIVVLAVAYLGWVLFRDSRSEGAAPGETTDTPAALAEPSSTPRAAPPVASAPGPRFAPPGVFYARERVSVETTTGVKALIPGEEVKLMYRYKDGKMRVTDGQSEFVVKPSALTQDREQVLNPAPK